jgi:hypothetical protein
MSLAYQHGVSDVPLRGETIGEMTVTGKIQKYKMRELEIAERGLVESKTA